VEETIRTAEDDLAELRQAVLDDWIVVTTRTAQELQDIQKTVSWRVTRPLRLVRRFQGTAREIGYGAALDLAAGAVARRLGRG